MNKELVLILGGVRSGKSNFAQRLAGMVDGNVVFMATAQAGDDEMAKRISRHKASRPVSWRTIEEPLELAQVLQTETASADVVLVDCLTLWLSNLLIRDGNSAEEEALKQVNMILDSYQRGDATYILVSGEVGMGLVPPYPMGRAFRDIMGRVNQEMAQRADRVFMLLAGIPLELKSLGMPWADMITGTDSCDGM